MKNTFNYRLVRHAEDCVAIHEIHYKDGEMDAYSPKPVLVGNDLDDLRGELDNVALAFTNQAINYKDLPK